MVFIRAGVIIRINTLLVICFGLAFTMFYEKL